MAALAQPPFQPYEGQPGKDVVWVPTPPALVEKMLDLAGVTAKDFVVDLGSGDGRNVIAAAKRGARALGVEYDPEMVKLSQQNAELAGVADKAKFVQGDMFDADFSQATVLALFLLPANLDKLRDKFLQLPAGTRIVNNGYKIHGWEEAETGHSDGFCTTWCTAYPGEGRGRLAPASGGNPLRPGFPDAERHAADEGRPLPAGAGQRQRRAHPLQRRPRRLQRPRARPGNERRSERRRLRVLESSTLEVERARVPPCPA